MLALERAVLEEHPFLNANRNPSAAPKDGVALGVESESEHKFATNDCVVC
jgi:hypothetical protein